MKPQLRAKRLLRLYIALSLGGATILMPLPYSVLPLAFLAFSLYIWLRGFNLLDLVAAYSAIFILPLLWQPVLGSALATAFSLPLLAYVDILLRSGTGWRYQPDSQASRRPTELGITLVVTSATFGLLAVLLGNLSLGLASLASLLYLTAIAILVLWGLPTKPLRESKTFFRVLAGSQAKGEVDIFNLTKLGGQLFLYSPYPWIKITPSVLPLSGPKVCPTFSIVPPLAGPASPEVQAVVLDPWGLSQVKLKLQPAQLHVIPRARYATWLAKKYLEKARPGMVVSHTPSLQLGGIHAARKGGEYYGARPYQPGDNLKTIDWKHSAKLAQLIVQEFTEPYTSSPLLLINLAAGDEEEADRLAFSLITTALTLARENIPAAMATYNEAEVMLVTDVLRPMELVRKTLTLTESIRLYHAPTKYLKPADITRLRINQERLRGSKLDSAQKLAQLLSLEYDALKASAELNPATKAATTGLARGKQLAQLIVISNLNHDTEALMLLASRVNALGTKLLFLEVGKTLSRGQLSFPSEFQLTSQSLAL